MPKAQPWPRRADEMRMDAIALTLDNDVLHVQLYAALQQGNLAQAAEINLILDRKNKRIRELLQEAKRA